MAARSRIIGQRRLTAKLRRLPDDLTDPIRQAVRLSALAIQTGAVTPMRAPKSDRLYPINSSTIKMSAGVFTL